jgi:hypothetical protein
MTAGSLHTSRAAYSDVTVKVPCSVYVECRASTICTASTDPDFLEPTQQVVCGLCERSEVRTAIAAPTRVPNNVAACGAARSHVLRSEDDRPYRNAPPKHRLPMLRAQLFRRRGQ